jgi:hypothetical protein
VLTGSNTKAKRPRFNAKIKAAYNEARGSFFD